MHERFPYWARVVLTKTAGLDDWIMTAAILPLIGTAVAVVLGEADCDTSYGTMLTLVQHVGRMGTSGTYGIKTQRL